MRVIRPNASFPQADTGQPEATASTYDTVSAASYRIDWEALRTATRSCCCPARPAVIAVMPPVPGRAHRTELLLCMHHFRVSRGALGAAGAVAVDLNRTIIGAEAPAYLGAPA